MFSEHWSFLLEALMSLTWEKFWLKLLVTAQLQEYRLKVTFQSYSIWIQAQDTMSLFSRYLQE